MYKNLHKKLYFLSVHHQLLDSFKEQSILMDERKFYEFVEKLSFSENQKSYEKYINTPVRYGMGSEKWYMTEIYYYISCLLEDKAVRDAGYTNHCRNRNFILWYCLNCTTNILREIYKAYKVNLCTDAGELILAKIELFCSYSKVLFKEDFAFDKTGQYTKRIIEKGIALL